MKKLKSLCTIILLICLISSYASASTWFGGVGNWDNPNNWAPPGVPDGTSEVLVYGTEAEATVDSDVVYTSWYSNRARFYGGATVKIKDGGNLEGIGWLLVGEGSRPEFAQVIQTGGALVLENGPQLKDGSQGDYKDPAGLTIGDGIDTVGVGEGLYEISGGILTFIHPEQNTSRQAGVIRIGDRKGEGTFHVIGTDPYIKMRALDIGGRNDKDETRSATGNLVYTLDAGGVSAIDVNYVDVHTYISSVTTLQVTLGVGVVLDDPSAVILLVNNTSADAVHGLFDTCNGGSAAEGAVVDLGDGIVRILTYVYDAETMVAGTGNDIALMSYGDFSGDGIVDMKDVPDFLNLWLVEDEIADLNGDGLINFYEFSVLANNWRK